MAQLNLDSLFQMLTNLAYEPRKANETSYEVVISRDGWDIVLDLSFSGDKSNLWISAYFGNKEPIAEVAAATWVALLRENWSVAPAHFALSNAALYLQRAVENQDITPVKLRKAIEQFDATVRRTVKVWSRDNFPPPPEAPSGATPSAAPADQGRAAIKPKGSLEL
jgi:hypothetical protein